MLDTGQDFALGRAIATQLIGYDHSRHVLQITKQLAEEPLCGLGIAPALDQNVEHTAVLIHGPPEVTSFASETEEHLAKLPGFGPPSTPGVPVGR